MAALSDADRQIATRAWIRRTFEELGGTATVTTVDIKAAIDALDDFLTSNETAINNAIPQPARGALTTTQKAMLVAYVAMRRAGVV